MRLISSSLCLFAIAVTSTVVHAQGSINPGSVNPGSVNPGSVNPGSVNPGSANVIHWALYSPECIVPSGENWVPAGNYGTFYFGPEDPELCYSPPITRGLVIDPEVYPPPGSAPPDHPCAAQECFTPSAMLPAASATVNQGIDPEEPGQPWVAIIDFTGWHGEAVAATVLHTTDPSVRAVFVPLQNPVTGNQKVTDADLLRSLAMIAEMIDRRGTKPPLAMNMSFGRKASPSDAHDLNCAPSTWDCQVSRLLFYLQRGGLDPQLPVRTALVASSGNHRSPLFPATLDHVITAGSLELASYTRSGNATGSWETSLPVSGSIALMPGSALCLPWQSGGARWAVPSGSSFATAIASGMLSDALLWHSVAVRQQLLSNSQWHPKRSCLKPNCPILLAQGETTYATPNYGATDLINYALFGDLSTCDEQWSATKAVSTSMLKVSQPPFLTTPSLVQTVAATHRPTPEPDPCVPCSLACEEDPFSSISGSVSAATRVSTKIASLQLAPVIAPGEATVLLTVDLHAGWELEPNTVIESLYLRYGNETYEILLTATELVDLAAGKIATLLIKGSVADPRMVQQPSLVSVLLHKNQDTGAIERYWQSTPMPLRAP